MKPIVLGETVIELYDDGTTITRFLDGTSVPAQAQDTDEYRARAQALSYGDDTAAMSRDHEILHTLLPVLMGKRRSNVLWTVAHDIRGFSSWQEESMVLALQQYCRQHDIDVVALAESWATRLAVPVLGDDDMLERRDTARN